MKERERVAARIIAGNENASAYVFRIKRALPEAVSAVVLISKLGGVSSLLGCVYMCKARPAAHIKPPRPPHSADFLAINSISRIPLGKREKSPRFIESAL